MLERIRHDAEKVVHEAEDFARHIPEPVKDDLESLFIKFVTTFATHSQNTVVKEAAKLLLVELGVGLPDPDAPVPSDASDTTTGA